MRIIRGTITNGVTLAAGDSPVLIGGVVTNDSTIVTSAVYGGAGIGADIRNAGTVGDPATFDGILLMGSGTITNGSPAATHAAIEGGSYGLKLAGTSTVTNYGSISSGFAGARLADGMITNGSDTDTTALISGGGIGEGLSFGELAGTGLGTVVNFGTIRSAGLSGVDLGRGGRITNGSSSDTQSVIAGGDGIRGLNGAVTVTNFGTVTATAAGGIGILGAYPIPVQITNGSSTSTKALISGTYGINAAAGSVVTNFGTITGNGSGGEALDLHGGTIVNGAIVNGAANSTAALLQGEFVGVYLTVAGRVTNYGQITGGGVSILLTDGGTIVNGSSSDQTALIGNGIDGIDVSGATAVTVTNFGTIEGVDSSILFGGGADRLIVEPGAKFIGTVDGGAGIDTVTFVGGGTLAVSNFAGFEDFMLTAASTLTLTNANFTGVTGGKITVVGGSGGNTVNAAAVTAANMVVLIGGAGTDTFTGGSGNDFFEFSAVNLAATDTVVGGGGGDTLLMTTAGTINAGGIRGVELFRLASTAANTLTLTNANFTGVTGGKITVVGGSGGNTVNAAAVTAANMVVLIGGAGTDTFTGGSGNDFFEFSAVNLAATDTVVGGGGGDTLLMTTAGTINAGGISGVETFRLASTAANTLTLTNANFTGVTGAKITVVGGSGGNTVNAAAVTGSDMVVLIGGAGNDVLTAGQHATMTGGGGTDTFMFITAGTLAAPDTNVITDFTSGTDKVDFSDAGFSLGLSGASSTPQALPPTLFASNSPGGFNSAAERFAYDTSTGALFYNAHGNTPGSSSQLVATLTGHPALTATDLFFTS